MKVFNDLVGGGVVQSIIQVCGVLFIVSVFMPTVRNTVYGWTDKLVGGIFPRPAPAPTLNEIGEEIEKRMKAGK